MRRKQSETSFGVIGLGRFGTALVKTLAEAGQEVIAVDKDEQKVKAVRKYTAYAFVVGTLNEESLQETGVQNCDTVTICIGRSSPEALSSIYCSAMIRGFMSLYGHSRIPQKKLCRRQALILRWTFL